MITWLSFPGGTGLKLDNVGDYMIFTIFYGSTDTAFAYNGTLLIGGYLLVQGRQADGSYADVTLEWLNLGIARENANAILRFQELHDEAPYGQPDGGLSLNNPEHSWPLNLYDSREGEVRDASGPTTCALGGIMNIVEPDVDNLRKWLGDASGTGTQVESTSQNGYLLYFSDRRGMLPPPMLSIPSLVSMATKTSSILQMQPHCPIQRVFPTVFSIPPRT